MKTKVEAVDSFLHGRWNAARGEQRALGKTEADDLVRAGLVKVVGEAADDEADDLVGAKVAPMTSNKMDQAPSNKSAPNAKK